MSTVKQKMRPREIAKEFGISIDKVLAWIKSGELRAINAAQNQNGRPRFLVDADDLAAFEASRAVIPTPAPAPRRRRDTKGVKQYF